MVCANCTARVEHEHQQRCRHCLDPLRVRRFSTVDEMQAYRRDRAAHGVDVATDGGASRKLGLASLFALGSMVLVLGALGLGLSAYFAGGLDALLANVGDAFWMLGLGVAMFVAARTVGRAGGEAS